MTHSQCSRSEEQVFVSNILVDLLPKPILNDNHIFGSAGTNPKKSEADSSNTYIKNKACMVESLPTGGKQKALRGKKKALNVVVKRRGANTKQPKPTLDMMKFLINYYSPCKILHEKKSKHERPKHIRAQFKKLFPEFNTRFKCIDKTEEKEAWEPHIGVHEEMLYIYDSIKEEH